MVGARRLFTPGSDPSIIWESSTFSCKHHIFQSADPDVIPAPSKLFACGKQSSDGSHSQYGLATGQSAYGTGARRSIFPGVDAITPGSDSAMIRGGVILPKL